MKFAMHDARTSELLVANNERSWAIAAFFFHDRGFVKQKSLVGMLQELLLSILQQIPELLRFVISPFQYLVRSQKSKTPTWDFDSLKSSLLAIVEQREVAAQIFLMVDALDEHDGDNELLASLLKELADKADHVLVKLKMCLASRSWTIFQHHFRDCRIFAIHEHTRQDIQTYVKDRLEHRSERQQTLSHQDGPQRIIELVTKRALGVFIWVRLVVDLLSKGFRDGTPYSTLEEQVNRMPQELKELYADTLRRIEPGYASEAYIMLQMAVCSLIPLPLNTFMACLDINYHTRYGVASESKGNFGRDLFGFDGILTNSLKVAEQTSKEPTTAMKSRLISRSGGLLEIVSMPSAELIAEDGSLSHDPGLVVQFIHQTVKEYVNSSHEELGLVGAPSELLKNKGDLFLLSSCVAENYDWARWVKKDMFLYANRCARARMPGQVIFEFLREALLCGRWISMNWFLEEQAGSFISALRRHEEDLELDFLYVIVAMGRPEYLPSTLQWYASFGRGRMPGILHIVAAGRYFASGSDVSHLSGILYSNDSLLLDRKVTIESICNMTRN